MNKEEQINKLLDCDFTKYQLVVNRIYKEEYVEKLEKENEKLNHYKLLYQKVKERNIQAIEYIEKEIDDNCELFLFDNETEDLLEILKGNNETKE